MSHYWLRYYWFSHYLLRHYLLWRLLFLITFIVLLILSQPITCGYYNDSSFLYDNYIYYLKWTENLMSYLWMDFVIHILVKPRFEPCLRNLNVLLTYYFWIWIVIISENAYCLQAYCQLWTYILYLNCFGIDFLRQSFAMSKGENLSGVGVVLRLRLNTYLTPSIHIDSWMYGWLQTPPLLHEILVGLPSLW